MVICEGLKNINRLFRGLAILLLGHTFLHCTSVTGNEEASPTVDQTQFNDYWYSGKAEITRYALRQARYGEIREGDAVLIFVIENFLTDKQVKHESGDSQNSTSVLKLNFTKKFYTGIYPYSMMTSIFTPVAVDKYPTLKVATSSQEWCGHTYVQINSRKNKLDILLRSYFQGEGDENFQIDGDLLEDGIWTKIRLAPDKLPLGEITMVPGSQFARLRHKPLKAYKATTELTTLKEPALASEDLQAYSINYPDLQRRLTIKFEKSFPHRILAWEESYKSGFGPNAKVLTIKAVKTHSMKSDYWSRNKLADSHLRDELGIIY